MIKNELVDRIKKETELLRWVREIAERDGTDGVEVISKLSEWKGRSYVNPAAMPDDRLAHTWLAAKALLNRDTGEPEVLDEDKLRALAVYLKSKAVREKKCDYTTPVEDFLEEARKLNRG